MTASTESDIKELKELIIAFREDVNTRLVAIETRLTVIETRLDTWKPSIDKIPDLAEKIGELKNWRQIAFVAITASIGGIVGWFARGNGFRP
ncbi:MAG: hypothetical protein HC820_01815 [Hydrococcus sp. RM1_1_31]|nr:hypothetical protein [Hydrococcus sp. RM1_1_31]